MPLSLQDQFATAEAVTLFGRLFALDQARTDYLERVEEPISEDDVSVLEHMTHVLEDLLEEAGRQAGYLNHIIELHPEELDKGYVRMLWTDALSGDQKMRLSFAVKRHGNLIESGMMSTAEVQSGVEAEREALETEMEAIYSGGSAAGDLSSRFLCNMAIACIAGGLLALPPTTSIVGVTLGLLMMGQVYARGEEC
jgi:hypothetical protein